jgi:DeoR/GlpR family transcriptional regulator of sugar metabolism
MLAAERQRAIANSLVAEQAVTVTALCQRFGVSANTIRRDLRTLERSHQATVVHGGAVINENRDTEIPFPKRQAAAVNEKTLIGERAAQMVQDGEAIILDAGTTTHFIAKALRCRQDLTVITNAINIAQELAGCPGIMTILSGGVLRAKSNCLIGQTAERTLGEWHVAKAFISAGGVELEAGLTNPNPFEVPVKQAMIRAAQKVILVATSEKFGLRSLAPFAALGSITTIITDERLPADTATSIRSLGIELIIAGAADNDRLASQEQL